MKVALFTSCIVDLLFPAVAESAARVLERIGVRVVAPEGAVCCGQVGLNSGHVSEARKVAKPALEALAEFDQVVCCAGSCTTMMREHWPALFAGTVDQKLASEVAEKTFEFSEFVSARGGLDDARMGSEVSVTYHDSCHMLRGLGLKEEPRRLLTSVGGLELRELACSGDCCGFGGSFSLRFPELSVAIADDKVDDIVSQDVDRLVGSDAGCLMHIWGRAAERGIDIPIAHVAQVLDEATAGTGVENRAL